MNVGILASAQAVEHYEITRYGTLIAWAQELGHKGAVPLLQANLKEEKAADEKLSRIAERRVNPKGRGGRAAVSGRRKKTASARGRKAAGGQAKSAGRDKSATRTAASRSKTAAKRKSPAKRKRA